MIEQLNKYRTEGISKEVEKKTGHTKAHVVAAVAAAARATF